MKMEIVRDLEFMARYPNRPRPEASTGPTAAMLDRLNSALFDCDDAERRFLDDLKHARSGGQLTEAGLKVRAGTMGDALLGPAAKWDLVADQGQAAIAEIDRTSTKTTTAATDVRSELRAQEIRRFIAELDQLQILPLLLTATEDGDEEFLSAVLDAPRCMQKLDRATADSAREAWLARRDPDATAARAALTTAVKNLRNAIRSLRSTIAANSDIEVHGVDPIKDWAKAGKIPAQSAA